MHLVSVEKDYLVILFKNFGALSYLRFSLKKSLLFQFLFQIRHRSYHVVEGRFKGPKCLMDFIGDDGALS